MKNLNEMTVKELKEMAKEMKISNWWNLKKSVLIEKIEAAQNMTEEEKQIVAEEQAKEDKLFEHYSNNWRKYGMTNNWTKFIEDYRKGKIELIEDIFAEKTEEIIEEAVEEIVEEAQEEIIEEPQPVVEEEKPKKDNGWEKIAKENIDNAFAWIIGGYENSVLDGEMTREEVEEWVKNDAVETLYVEAISTRYTGESCGGNPPAAMKHATKKWCVKYIVELLKAEGYEVEMPEIIEEKKEGHKPTAKRGQLLEWNGKAQNICAWGKELGISPNTLYGRIYKMGWDIDKAFTTPGKRSK